jgi:hypothetical protein
MRDQVTSHTQQGEANKTYAHLFTKTDGENPSIYSVRNSFLPD